MPTVAAIDVGSNATRFATLTVSPSGIAEPLQLHRFSLRLGADVFAHGALGRDIRKALREAFVTMADQMRERGVSHYRAVATSAMRDAQNGPDVVQELEQATGIRLEIISGEAESALSREALMRAMGSVPADAMIADLGGGSLELDRPKSKRGRSLPLGTVRLLERFPFLRRPVGAEQLQAVRQELAHDLERGWPRAAQARLGIGTGGNLELLAHLVGDPSALVPRIRLDALPAFVQTVAKLPLETRIASYELRRDRADLIVPAALVILALHDWLGLEALAVPRTGLRDALLRTQLAALTPPVPQEPRFEGSTRWQFQAKRATRWLDAWFDKLTPLHELWPQARIPLHAVHAAWAWGTSQRPESPLAIAQQTLAQAGLAPEAQTLAHAALVALDTPGPLPIPAGVEPGAKLAALVRLSDACAAASTAVPRCDLDLLNEPVALVAASNPALSASVLSAMNQAFGRPLVLQARS